jgi:hypothetical protein
MRDEGRSGEAQITPQHNMLIDAKHVKIERMIFGYLVCAVYPTGAALGDICRRPESAVDAAACLSNYGDWSRS